MAKLVKYYMFIPFLLVFLLSHNVSAIDVTFNLNEYEKLDFDVSQNYYDYKIYKSNGSLDHQCLATFNCYVGNNQQIRVAATHDSFPLKTGDIIVYNLALYSPAYLHHIDNLQFRALAPGYGLSTLYFHEVSDFSAIGGFTESFPTSSSQGIIDTTGYFVSNVYEIAEIATVDGNRQLGSFNQNTVDIAVNLGNSSSGDVLVVAVTGFTVYRYTGSQENKEQKEAAEDAAADSQTSGSSSQNDATNATSSLISVITSGIGAITSASASNCVIDADMGNFDMGSIDLCANPVPAFMQIIGSIIAALVVLPLVIVLFNRFITIIGSFQR